jgi:hypothetical protein
MITTVRLIALCVGVMVTTLTTSAAFASTYVGAISQISTQPSPSNPSTNIRVSIYTASSVTTSCSGGAAQYAFDLPAGPVLSMYEAQLLAAIVSGRNVKIVGNATCDTYSDEGVTSITSQ